MGPPAYDIWRGPVSVVSFAPVPRRSQEHRVHPKAFPPVSCEKRDSVSDHGEKKVIGVRS